MPRLPEFRVSALAKLAHQLRFESPVVARHQLDRVEALALDLLGQLGSPSPPGALPEDWVIFRITGLRSTADSAGPLGDQLVTDAVMGDLGPLAQRLSRHAQLSTLDTPPDRWLSQADVIARWKTSRRTLARLQRQGLLARRVRTGPGPSAGHETLRFARSLVDAFESARPSLIQRATGPDRLTPEQLGRLLAAARELAAATPSTTTITQCARELAKRFNVDPDTIRRHLRAARPPIFTEKPRVSRALLAAAAQTALRMPGQSVRTQAQRLGRSRSSAYRADRIARTDRLRTLLRLHQPPPPPRPVDISDKALYRLLADPTLLAALRSPVPITLEHALANPALLPALALTPATPVAHERALARTYRTLLLRASSLVRRPLRAVTLSSASLDRAETDLRIAALIKTRLAHHEIPMLLRAIEAHQATPLARMPMRLLTNLAYLGFAALVDVIDQFDPDKFDLRRGARLAAPISIALSRVLARPPAPARASGLASVTSAQNPAVAAGNPQPLWHLSLLPSPRLLAKLPQLSPAHRELLERRLGLDPSDPIPQTCAQIAQEKRTTPSRIRAIERAALNLIGSTL